MIKQKDITPINVDNYIRERKASGAKVIKWTNINALASFMRFAQAMAAPLPGVSMGMGFNLPDDFPNNHTFMGIKHIVRIKRKNA